ncbi:DUF3311 family protein [Natrialba magadii ATCC 43099]|uniref:DUF3311 family protein n=1 Tax=Natrialba magadii (strain ATCC 43099 / DSM 3394 / CCM 3739 / CIP 104546 / IAM 13178 / JCM 8861 / NBRC 102185 / NCIMB 2190 / MS3) TaxID=547559 RepID=D3SS87_NATMM|nr:DUF3311 domain-containing protein [Natrialba magadii]ADD04813.1 DUF3311 family protein [Natrialba magadii ATCC 43099]ELY24480.1 hypothetical protein C500_18670 [Natrialba magadii ATCC 43099]
MRHLQLVGWLAVAVVLCALAIPWFLWGDSRTVAGIPLWLWWHIGWMGLTSVVFWLFSRHAWGLGIEPGGATQAGNMAAKTETDAGGDQP